MPIEKADFGRLTRQLFLVNTSAFHADGGRSSIWLEHLVVVQEVAGSSPVARPTIFFCFDIFPNSSNP